MTIFDNVGVSVSSGVVRMGGRLNLNSRLTPVVAGCTETVQLYAMNDSDIPAFCQIQLDMCGNERATRVQIRSAERTPEREYGSYDGSPVQIVDLPVAVPATFLACIRPHSAIEIEVDATWVPFGAGVDAPILRIQPFPGGALEVDNRNDDPPALGGPTI